MTYRTDSIRRETSKDRRDMLRDLGLCINGPSSTASSRRSGVTHGEVSRGGKCERCCDVATGRNAD